MRTDVTDPVSVDDLARASKAQFGAYHVVCNNAGVAGHLGRSWETPLEDWRWVFDVNVWGVINGIRSFVPSLIAQGEGHVVNTASLAGWAAAPAMAPYAASKHAVLAISESLRAELVASGTEVGAPRCARECSTARSCRRSETGPCVSAASQRCHATQ